ncbi:MAG: hypothetical protein GXX99_01555 [Clostridiales bacterium]|nr:hypothetical protein [Clostridiales bacterium]
MAYNQTLGYDPDIADYSLLIAGTRDRQARDELLRQRQNKLDHLQAQGTKNPDWASNQTVSGWTELSQPGGWNNATAAYNPHGGVAPAVVGAPAPSGAIGLQTSALQRRYEEATAAQQQALRRAVELEAGRLDAQKEAATADYEAMARQAYIQYMRDLQALPTALSRHGLQGGVTESALTALGTAYQENLYQGDLARRRTQEQLDAAIAELRAKGGIEAAQAAAENAARQAEALQSLYRSLLEEQRWQQQFDFTAQQQAQRQEQSRQQLAAEAEQQDYRRRLEVAKLQAAAGPRGRRPRSRRWSGRP